MRSDSVIEVLLMSSIYWAIFVADSLSNMQRFRGLRCTWVSGHNFESTLREWDRWTKERARITDSDGSAGCPDGGRLTGIGDPTFHFVRSIRDRLELMSRSLSRDDVWRIVALHGTDETISFSRDWSFRGGVTEKWESDSEQSSRESDHFFFNDFVEICGNSVHGISDDGFFCINVGSSFDGTSGIDVACQSNWIFGGPIKSEVTKTRTLGDNDFGNGRHNVQRSCWSNVKQVNKTRVNVVSVCVKSFVRKSFEEQRMTTPFGWTADWRWSRCVGKSFKVCRGWSQILIVTIGSSCDRRMESLLEEVLQIRDDEICWLHLFLRDEQLYLNFCCVELKRKGISGTRETTRNDVAITRLQSSDPLGICTRITSIEITRMSFHVGLTINDPGQSQHFGGLCGTRSRCSRDPEDTLTRTWTSWKYYEKKNSVTLGEVSRRQALISWENLTGRFFWDPCVSRIRLNRRLRRFVNFGRLLHIAYSQRKIVFPCVLQSFIRRRMNETRKRMSRCSEESKQWAIGQRSR